MFKSLYSLEYVSTNILQERMNLSYACSWFDMNLQIQESPLQLWKWMNKSRASSNIKGNLALSLSKTQARRLMRSREQLTSYHPI
jgi:hypothetical protein